MLGGAAASRDDQQRDFSVGHENKDDIFRRSEASSKEDELQEMNQVREENTRLKMMLEKIDKEYKSLQMQFDHVLQQESRKVENTEDEEPDFVSLRLGRGRSQSQTKNDEKNSNNNKTKGGENNEKPKDELKLGLDYNVDSNSLEHKSEDTENSSEETKKETWSPGKVSKTTRSEDDEVSQQSSVKRARVSVRTRCDTATMNDGCQWRKYGQKISKGNPCPRAYYRCTVAPACPVRKQVQRCSEDMTILITTYEGEHNHQLPFSATAMASTTSAAASMLLSGSSTTTQLAGTAISQSAIGTRPFCLPSSVPPAFPTITLDLTTSTTNPSTQFGLFSSGFQSTPPTRFPSRNLSFSSSESNILPKGWGAGYLNYGIPPYTGRQTQEQRHQTTIGKNQSFSQSQPLAETLTKAITSDPSFRSVIAAAISSMVRTDDVGQQTEQK